jgi:hypothetical protein
VTKRGEQLWEVASVFVVVSAVLAAFVMVSV